MAGIGRKISFAMLIIVVLLIVWQFVGSLRPEADEARSA